MMRPRALARRGQREPLRRHRNAMTNDSSSVCPTNVTTDRCNILSHAFDFQVMINV